MTSSSGAEIERLEERIVQLAGPMEEAAVLYRSAAIGWLRFEAQRMIDDAITFSPDRTIELGPQRLATMKARFRRIWDQAPELIARHLNHDDQWPHRNPPEQKPWHMTVTRGLQELLGCVGSLLIEYGYEKPVVPGLWPGSLSISIWEKADALPWWKFSSPTLQYRSTGEPKVSAEMVMIGEAYTVLCTERNECIRARREQMQSRKRSHAQDLWKRL